MNRQLSRIFSVFAGGFVLLIALTAYWQIWAQGSLAAHRNNLLEVVHEQSIDRGLIRAADGTILARNRKRKTRDGRTVFERVYPTRRMFAHVVGYSSVTAKRSGLEQAQNDYLTGANTDLAGFLSSQLDTLAGKRQRGSDVWTTLLPAVQRAATGGLAATGLPGAAVAIEPDSGKVLALASWPSFDPNLAVRGGRAWLRLQRGGGGALLDRATQGRYPPGSTFKAVTAAVALDSGRYTPQSTFFDPGFAVEYGRKIANNAGERFGNVDLTTALTQSINSVFARIGMALCPRSRCPLLTGQMQRFGFYARPPLDLPDGEKLPSGLLRPGTSRLASPNAPLDPARTAIGQYTLAVTPLQMAMVAAGIANAGAVMRPYLVDHVQKPDGSRVQHTRPRTLGRAMSPAHAAELAGMMTHVVEEGTGTAAALRGVRVAGKTGTAQTSVPGKNDAWFIAFAPVDHPRIAVAVVVEGSSGFGGVVAAPIAKAMIEAALARSGGTP